MEAKKADYLANMDKQVTVGNYTVTVRKHTNESRSGSYERGLKWTDSTYGYLERVDRGWTFYSFDHGKTWSHNKYEAAKVRAGKILLHRQRRQEFAFDSIQKLNREYHGPGYKWTP